MSNKDRKRSLLTALLGKLSYLNVAAAAILVFAIVNLLAR